MTEENQLKTVIMWLPREDEHELAASLGLCEPDRATLEQLIEAAQHQVAEDQPDTVVVVKRWHVWRVVREMVRLGVLNTPDGRAAAYVCLNSE